MQTDEILRQSAETYKKKNADYGQSWKMIGEMLWMMAGQQPVTLESPEDMIAFGLFTRRFDKLARSFNGEFVTDTLTYESAADSDEDESVYAAMQAENKYDRETARRDRGDHPWDADSYGPQASFNRGAGRAD